MVSSPVSALYERYKQGTNVVVTWLARTGGFEKNRTDNSTTITLSTKDITNLATSIFNNTNSKRPPSNGIETNIKILESVIQGRRDCQSWYAQRTEGNEEHFISNEGHQHFINVLQNIHETLREVCRRCAKPVSTFKRGGQATKGKGKSTTTDIASSSGGTDDILRNIYENLDVEEPAVHALGSSVANLNVITSSASKQNQTFELEAQNDDCDFALWACFQQCHEIRNYTRGIWHEYLAGKISIADAAEITDTAYFLIKHANEVFAAHYPNLATFEQVANHLHIEARANGRNIEQFQCLNSAEHPQAADILCVPAFLTLTFIRKERQEYSTLSKQEFTGLLDFIAQSSRSSTDPFSVLIENDRQKGVFIDFVKTHGTDLGAVEMLVAACGSSFSLSSIVIFQISMDITDLLEESRFYSLRCVSRIKISTESRIQQFEKNCSHLDLFRQLGEKLQKSAGREGCNSLITDGLEKNIDVDMFPVKRSPSGAIGNLLQNWVLRFPVTAGKIMGKLSVGMYVDGLLLCEQDHLVLCAAHIYRACRVAGLIKRPWKDMEIFIDMVGASNLGLHSAPTVLSAAKHLGLAFGADIGRCGRGRQTQTTGVRVPLPPRDRLKKRGMDFVATSTYIQSIKSARKSARTLELDIEQAVHYSAYQSVANILDGQGRTVDPEILQRWQACRKLSPVDVLQCIKNALAAEELQMYLDLHRLFYYCGLLLDTVRKLKKEEQAFSLHHTLHDEFSTVEMTYDVLWDAAEAEMVLGSVPKEASLYAVADRLNRLVEVDGSAMYDNACLLRDTQRYDCDFDTSRFVGQRISPVAMAGASLLMKGCQITYTAPGSGSESERRRKAMEEVAQDYSEAHHWHA